MKKYAMGKKLDRYEKILYFISAVIVYGFCYIYHAVFQIKNIAVSGYILFAAFSAIELLVIWLISKAVDVYRKSTYYVLDAKGITCYGFRLKEYYRWSDFEDARFDYARILGMRNLPVIFIVAGKRLRLSSYVDGFNDLNLKLLSHIGPVVSDDLKEKLPTFQ